MEQKEETEKTEKTERDEVVFPEFDGEKTAVGAPSGERFKELNEAPMDGMNEDVDGSKPSKKKSKRARVLGTVALSLGIAAVSFFTGYGVYAATLDPELRSLIWAKKRIQKNYIEEVTDDEFYDAVFSGVNSLLDPYSQYFSAEEYKAVLESATGRWIGMGITFSVVDANGNDRLLAIRVAGNSPAEQVGIKAGTYVLGFGGSEETVKDSVSYTELTGFLKDYGEGEKFVLKLRDGETGEPYYRELSMESFVENYVFYRSSTTAYSFVGKNATQKEATDNVLSALDDQTAYIRITEFNGRAAAEFALAMKVFKEEGKKNLVLDLRMNGGGYMDILSEIAAYLCKDAKSASPVIAAAVYKNGKRDEFKASGNKFSSYFSADSKISVLADADTASASECLIGCMVDYGTIGFDDIYLSYRGGEARTYGKGIMQTTYPRFFFGSTDAIKLTTANIVWPVSGKSIHGVGVTPADGASTVSENYAGDAEIFEAVGKILAK
ncbi:MAG: hypothetical protein IJY62_04310 [Clostridia bacterium]|nr:hypothetical protein [Clostridia bacterium]